MAIKQHSKENEAFLDADELRSRRPLHCLNESLASKPENYPANGLANKSAKATTRP